MLFTSLVAYVPTGQAEETMVTVGFGALPRVGEILELVGGFPKVSNDDRRLVVLEVIHTLTGPSTQFPDGDWLPLVRCRPLTGPSPEPEPVVH
jgi:hypothetical protein